MHPCFPPLPPLAIATFTTSGNLSTVAVGEDVLSLSASLRGCGKSGESKKPWKGMHRALEVAATCTKRIPIKVASQPKLS